MLAIILLNVCLVFLTVVIHYEVLFRLTRRMPFWPFSARLRVLLGVLLALSAHAIEVWVFAVGYWLALGTFGLGSLEGDFTGTFLDCVYFSFTTFTTLGFGDIQPMGMIRYLTGIESLTGLVLVTWSASFLFLEMQKHWYNEDSKS